MNGWKWIAIILILLMAVSLIWKGCSYVLSHMPFVPEDYTEKVQTGGETEAKYFAMGPHETAYYEADAMMSFQKFEIYYPKDIERMEPLSAVVFVNGTGVKGSRYRALQQHLASWGFLTIATEEEHAWNGFSAEMSVRYLELLNMYQEEGKDNVFCHKIDMERIGITGHSQGGIGVINAITNQKHADTYQAAVLLSATQNDIASALMWESDAAAIHTNVLILASIGQSDAAIAPLDSMQMMYDGITEDVSKVIARRNDCDHGEMLYAADGYVTAWLMYYLQGDEEAGKAFFDEQAEIAGNPFYQDVQIHR